MKNKIKQKTYNVLRWSEKYMQTDMDYLAKGGSWFFLGYGISLLASFVLAVVLANVLPKETYGTYKYILSIASIMAASTLAGMNASIVRAVARGNEKTLLPALKTRMKWGILGSVISLFIGGYYFFNNNEVLGISFLILTIFVPFRESFSIYETYWHGKKKFNVFNKYLIATQVINAAVIITAAILTKNVVAIIAAYFVSDTSLKSIFLRKTIPNIDKTSKIDQGSITYGKHISAMNIVGMISQRLDSILIWHFFGAVPVAIYSFAIMPPIKIKDLFKIIGNLALPRFSERSPKELKTTMFKKILKAEVAVIPVVIVYILTAPFIYRLIFQQYTDSIIYSQVLILALLAIVPSILLASSFIAQMEKKKLYIYKIGVPTINILLLLTILPFYGLWGAVIAFVVTKFIELAVLLFLFYKL